MRGKDVKMLYGFIGAAFLLVLVFGNVNDSYECLSIPAGIRTIYLFIHYSTD